MDTNPKIGMLKNYLRTAFRSLWRHKGFSSLNIAGLAIGMSAFFFIAQYVKLETCYDDFVPKKDRIFRLVADIRSPASNLSWAATSPAMAINLRKDYPEVADIVRLNWSSFILRRGDKKFQEDNTVMADSSVFKIFDYPLLQGDPQTALREPFTLVLSRSTAKKYSTGSASTSLQTKSPDPAGCAVGRPVGINTRLG